MFVNTLGLNKADVLATLYNTAKVPEYTAGPYMMSREFANKLIVGGNNRNSLSLSLYDGRKLDFEYIYGRLLNVNLRSGNGFDASKYDAANGGDGIAKRAIDHLRKTGNVCITPDYSAIDWLKKVIEESLEAYDNGDYVKTIDVFKNGIARHSGTAWICDDPYSIVELAILAEPRSTENRNKVAKAMNDYLAQIVS